MTENKRGYYPKRMFRISDEVLEEFRKQKQASGLTWNLFIANLIGLEKAYDKED